MAIGTNGIFTMLSRATDNVWKPVARTRGEINHTAPKPAATGGDTVSVSSLGKALTGMAAEAFSHFDPDAKRAMDALVKSGVMTADEVALGLRQMVTREAFHRFSAERPKDGDDEARSSMLLRLDDAFMEKNRRLEAANQPRRDLKLAFGRGDIDEATFLMKSGDVMKQLGEEHAAASQAGADASLEASGNMSGGLLNEGFEKSKTMFEALSIDRGPGGFVSLDDGKAMEAAQKLQASLGNNPSYFAAVGRFAAALELPGIGRGTE